MLCRNFGNVFNFIFVIGVCEVLDGTGIVGIVLYRIILINILFNLKPYNNLNSTVVLDPG